MADSFLASLIGPSRKQLRLAPWMVLFGSGVPTIPLTLGFWFRIVPAPAAHMQWQRARIGQIG
jgi:hypothetical protein